VVEAEVHVIAYEEVETAVVVIVEKGGAASPAMTADAGFVGYVGEGAVAVISVRMQEPKLVIKRS